LAEGQNVSRGIIRTIRSIRQNGGFAIEMVGELDGSFVRSLKAPEQTAVELKP
jgi:hypothetical protein